MSDRAREAERKLSDYPISLRHSARAVFGSACEPEDGHVLAAVAKHVADQRVRPKS